jgi:predicted transcriptional regulator
MKNMILRTLTIAIQDDIKKVDTLTSVITKPRRLMELATLKQQLKRQLLTLTEI